MFSPPINITFEALGVFLGIYLIYLGIILRKIRKLKTISIINIILGIGSIIIDSIFIISNL